MGYAKDARDSLRRAFIGAFAAFAVDGAVDGILFALLAGGRIDEGWFGPNSRQCLVQIGFGMTSDPIVSIVTATHNLVQAGRLEQMRRCVRSVASLPVPHEHLIQDGNSTDGTRKFLDGLSNEYGDLSIESAADSGVYDAFNKAVSRAKGKWIYFLGSDDYIFSPETMRDVIRAAECSGKRFVISLVRNSDGLNWFSGRKDFANILIIKPYGHQGVLMTRDLIFELGLFDVHYRIASDFKLCLQAHLAGVSHLLAKKAFAEFAVGNGISTTDGLERCERLTIAGDLLDVCESDRPLLMKKQLLPWRVIFKCLVHSNAVIRQGARYAFARRCANVVGLLDEFGGPKSFTFMERAR